METKGNILIIEDDGDIRECVSILLKSEGYEITEVDCGIKGLELFSEDIDLVLLDIMLPDISGLKICEKIRESSVVPILFLTAKVMESDKLVGLMAGGDDYLTKPFSYAELLGRVKSLLRMLMLHREAGTNKARIAAPRYSEAREHGRNVHRFMLSYMQQH